MKNLCELLSTMNCACGVEQSVVYICPFRGHLQSSRCGCFKETSDGDNSWKHMACSQADEFFSCIKQADVTGKWKRTYNAIRTRIATFTTEISHTDVIDILSMVSGLKKTLFSENERTERGEEETVLTSPSEAAGLCHYPVIIIIIIIIIAAAAAAA